MRDRRVFSIRCSQSTSIAMSLMVCESGRGHNQTGIQKTSRCRTHAPAKCSRDEKCRQRIECQRSH
jgi:hypothetical protein